jgi:CHAD domain-containing protein
VAVTRERELKFELRRGVAEPSWPNGQGTVKALEATYFDTDDLRLARFGSTLRYRNDEGWTVKLPVATDGALVSRREVLFAGERHEPPAGAVALVSSLTRGASLDAVATLSSNRRSIDLDVGELVDDDVVARAPDGRIVAEFREVELELADTAGQTAIDAVVDELRSAGAVEATPLPKLVRALGPPAVAPADVDPPVLSDHPTLREVIQRSLGVSTRTLLMSLAGLRLDEDPEDVHQARVSIRRIRSDLRVFRNYLDRRWAGALNDELRRLGAALGEVRDLDVATEMLGGMHLGGEGFAQLRARIEADRMSARDRLIDTLGDAWCLQLLEHLVESAADPRVVPQADDPAEPALVGVVSRPWRRLRRAVRALPDPPPEAALHEIRILAKRCRYAADTVRPVLGAPAKRLSKRATAIQDSLGYLNDAAVITAHFQSLGGRLSPEAMFAAGQVSGILIERADEHHSEWRAAWKRLDRKSTVGWLR